MRTRKRGFTLVELIVVIAIIAVMAAVVSPNAYKAVHKAKIAKTAADMKAIKGALLAYYADTGKFPDPFYYKMGAYGHRNSDCAWYPFSSPPLTANEDNVAGWDGPYLDRVLTSPLSPVYVSGGYTYPGTYWIGGTNCYNQCFDLNGDGTNDICNAANVQLAGLTLADALALDKLFDGTPVNGQSGSMNIAAGSGYYYARLYAGASN